MTSAIPARDFIDGIIHYSDRSDRMADIKWMEHPTFKGVHLKHIIKGCDSGGLFSSHLVKIDPDCCLESHIHADQFELHEVLAGKGTCKLLEKTFPYATGKMTVIPKGQHHGVHAGPEGLTLLAKFFPALL
ncbi:cupin domain-containing protein [Desulfogranum japonicum]|uniref:cupin domain-containing protein n=1 Tax=Desulfogranum japonicum TaxID=231447 RepID=UPI00040E1882|nr:cupin domain-containing protein [Desulfogranum japonicum]